MILALALLAAPPALADTPVAGEDFDPFAIVVDRSDPDFHCDWPPGDRPFRTRPDRQRDLRRARRWRNGGVALTIAGLGTLGVAAFAVGYEHALSTPCLDGCDKPLSRTAGRVALATSPLWMVGAPMWATAQIKVHDLKILLDLRGDSELRAAIQVDL